MVDSISEVTSGEVLRFSINDGVDYEIALLIVMLVTFF